MKTGPEYFGLFQQLQITPHFLLPTPNHQLYLPYLWKRFEGRVGMGFSVYASPPKNTHRISFGEHFLYDQAVPVDCPRQNRLKG